MEVTEKAVREPPCCSEKEQHKTQSQFSRTMSDPGPSSESMHGVKKIDKVQPLPISPMHGDIAANFNTAARIAASIKKMEQAAAECSTGATKEAKTGQQETHIPFLRTTSEPSPRSALEQTSTIFDAVKKGDIQMIDRMLYGSKSILKNTDGTGSRPIHIAARHCQLEVLKHLDKIDPMLMQTRNDTNMTVLHFCVQNTNRKDCLNTLRFIRDRTNPDTVFEAADTDKSSDLSYEELFTAYGHVVGPEVLKRIFAEVDEDKSGGISLEEFKKALSNGNLTPLPLVKDSSGSTACHVAAQRNNQIAILFFQKYCPDMMKLRDNEGRLPVHILAFSGSIDTLKALCKDGNGPLEEKDFMNASLAHHASAGGQVEMLRYLSAELGEDMFEVKDRNGSNLAHWAARSGQIIALQMISANRPELLSTKNRDGKTPKEICFCSKISSFLDNAMPSTINRVTSDPGPIETTTHHVDGGGGKKHV